MARINNTKKYPKNTEVKKEDFIIGTQASTGKTINITVDAINKLSPSGGDNGSIKDITFRGEKLEKVNKTVDLPNKLSQFENDLDPSGEGGKIDNVSFKGEDLPVVGKRVELPSDLSQFTDSNKIIPDTSAFVDETQVQNKIEDWSIKNIETIDKLKQEVGKEGQKVRLLGYYSAGDKPELLYEWKNGLGEDDGGSVVNSTTGRWEALFNGEIDVRDFGFFDGYIGESFIHKINRYSKVNFPIGTFTFTNNTKTTIHTDVVVTGHNTIIKTADTYTGSRIFIELYVKNIVIQGIEIKGENRVCEGLRVFHNGTEDYDIVIRDCKFNGFIMNEFVNGGTVNTCGIYVRGNFNKLHVHDVDISESEIDYSKYPSTASRGIMVSSPVEGEFVKDVIIERCNIKGIRRVNVPEGVARDADCIFVNSTYSIQYVEEEMFKSSLHCYNNYFEDFSGRAIKSQVGITNIYGNKVNCNVDFQDVFGLQRNSGNIFNNQVNVNVDSSGKVFTLGIYDDKINGINIYNNTVTIGVDSNVTVFQTGASSGTSTRNIGKVNIYNNIIRGYAATVLKVRIQSQSTNNNILFNNNNIEDCGVLVSTWLYGISTFYGLLKLHFDNNIIKCKTIWDMFQNSTVFFKSFNGNEIQETESNTGINEINIGINPELGTNVSNYVTITSLDDLLRNLRRFEGEKGKVNLYEGVYPYGNVDIPVNISIEGIGSVEVRPTTAVNSAFRFTENKEETTIKNIKFTGGNDTTNIVQGNLSKVTFDTCEFRTGLRAVYPLVESPELQLKNCIIDGFNNTGAVIRGNNIFIENTIIKNITSGIRLTAKGVGDNFNIINSTIEECSSGVIVIATTPNNFKLLNIENCIIRNIENSGVSIGAGVKNVRIVNSLVENLTKPVDVIVETIGLTIKNSIETLNANNTGVVKRDEVDVSMWIKDKWVRLDNVGESVTGYFPIVFGANYSQNQSFGEATLVKKGNEVFYKIFANKSTNVEVGDTVFTLQPELRPKSPEFIVGHGGNGAMVVWLMIEPATGAVKVQEFPTEGSVTTTNAIVMSGSFFIKE